MKLESVLASTSDAVISIGKNHRILSWNRGAEKLLGYSAEEAMAMEVMQIIPPRFHDRHISGVERFVATRIPHAIGKTVELAALHRDGHEFPIELTLSSWEEGSEVLFAGIIRDITERKVAETAVRASEKRLKSITDSTADAIISISPENKILSWNKGAEILLGYTAEEAVNTEIMRIIPARFRDSHLKGIARFLETRIPHAIGRTVELAALHRDGHEFPIELTLSSWEEGSEVFFAGIIRDITERKTAETAVRASEQRMKSITESTVDAIISINPQNKILTWNSGAEKLLGYKSGEVLDTEIMRIIPERFRDRHLKGLARFLETGIPHAIGATVELAALHRDGHEFPIELTLSTWEEGGEPMFTGIIRDITARKKAEADLETERLLLKREKDRTEELLLNILPISIAKELQHTGKVETREFKDATVLFADFVGFTRLAESVSGIDLVGELDFYFRNFDAIVGKYRLEKIKTIGDAYMCASGLPEEDGSCVMDCVLAALEMVRVVQVRNRTRPPLERWQVRIGLNSGPVIAGIVGEKKFVYDIWGNTVNLASRIESYGIRNRVCVSDNTRKRIDHFFEFEPLGSIDLKNIGKHESFAIRSFRKDLSRDGKGKSPAPQFFEMCRTTHGCGGYCKDIS